jgi:hypothetical protein
MQTISERNPPETEKMGFSDWNRNSIRNTSIPNGITSKKTNLYDKAFLYNLEKGTVPFSKRSRFEFLFSLHPSCHNVKIVFGFIRF